MNFSKIKAVFLIPLLAIFALFSNCTFEKKPIDEKNVPSIDKVEEQPVKPQFPKPFEADFEREMIEAQKLVESGISFENTMSSHGAMTEKGSEFSSNEFKSFDGVDLTLQAQLYNSPEELDRAFNKSLKDALKIFGQKVNNDGERRFDGANDRNALVVYVNGSFLYTVFSPSVRHLIAFETKEPAYFGGS